jgi:hypothetical protein
MTVKWARNQNCEAALIQATGRVSEPSCRRCLAGDGPFVGCVVSLVTTHTACANCHYALRDTRCCFYDSRSARISRSGFPRLSIPRPW